MPTSIIVAERSSTTANSYVSLADAEQYFRFRRNTRPWDMLTEDADKEVALIQATNWLEQWSYEGFRCDFEQKLSWPRHQVYDRDEFWIDSETVPQFVKDAQCECALAILEEDQFADTGLERFKTAMVGGLQVEVRQERKAGALPRVVERILGPYLIGGGGSSISLIRA